MKNTYLNLKETYIHRMCGYCEIGQDWHSGVLTTEVIYGEELIDHEDIKNMILEVSGSSGISEDIPDKVLRWFIAQGVEYCKCTYELGNVLNLKIEMEYTKEK